MGEARERQRERGKSWKTRLDLEKNNLDYWGIKTEKSKKKKNLYKVKTSDNVVKFIVFNPSLRRSGQPATAPGEPMLWSGSPIG